MRLKGNRVRVLVGIAVLWLVPTSKAQERSIAYDVVPPLWLARSADSAEVRSTAYIFPSLYGTADVTAVDWRSPDFFRPQNRFHTPKEPFQWSSNGKQIQIDVRRNDKQPEVEIRISRDSRANIRRLTWEEFRDLRDSFRDWLCKRSGCRLFGQCESRFAHLDEDLGILWKNQVLADATFKLFADAYLNTTKPDPIVYTGSVPALKDIVAQTKMFAARSVPHQEVVVTWGIDNFFPSTTTSILDTYSRIGSGAQTQIETVFNGCEGTRLFPSASSEMDANSQWQVGTKKGLSPFPSEWADLFGKEIVPIYNLFDLHNDHLLVTQSSKSKACPNERKGPKYLFVLTPAKYLKPDIGPTNAMAQFENEARPGYNPISSIAQAKDDLIMLTRQFLLVGCDEPDPDKPPEQFQNGEERKKWDAMDSRHKLLANLNAEWDHLLESAFAAYKPASGSPVSARACGPYASGVFAGKSFVELRHHFSVNAYPTNKGALNLQTIGQVIAPFFAAALDRIATQGARPLAVIVRSADIGYGLSPGVMRIRFYTTMGPVLDQANIFEGDEIHVGPISEDLREE